MKHRRLRDVSCKDCLFFDEGACKRYPPVVLYHESIGKDDEFVSVFPGVEPDDWCGEFAALDQDLIRINGEL